MNDPVIFKKGAAFDEVGSERETRNIGDQAKIIRINHRHLIKYRVTNGKYCLSYFVLLVILVAAAKILAVKAATFIHSA